MSSPDNASQPAKTANDKDTGVYLGKKIKRFGAGKSHLKSSNHHEIADALTALLNPKIVIGKEAKITMSPRGWIIQVPAGGSVRQGVDFDGEWVDTKSYPAKTIVIVSTGATAGCYISTQAVPAGNAPDVGSDYWAMLARFNATTYWM